MAHYLDPKNNLTERLQSVYVLAILNENNDHETHHYQILKAGMTINQIAQVTGLTEEQD